MLLHTARDLPLVAPRVDVLQVGRNGNEQIMDGGETRAVLFLNRRRDGGLMGLDAGVKKYIKIRESLSMTVGNHLPLQREYPMEQLLVSKSHAILRPNGMSGCSHFLAQGGDLAGGLDDAFAAIMMQVEFIAEDGEHGHKRGLGRCGGGGRGLFQGMFDAGHCFGKIHQLLRGWI